GHLRLRGRVHRRHRTRPGVRHPVSPGEKPGQGPANLPQLHAAGRVLNAARGSRTRPARAHARVRSFLRYLSGERPRRFWKTVAMYSGEPKPEAWATSGMARFDSFSRVLACSNCTWRI